MNVKTAIETEWPFLLSHLGTEDELLESARRTGAWSRRRAFASASDLLRLVLAYGAVGLSLRQTAAWAEGIGMASVSDVAVLQRLRKAGPWLAYLLDQKLHQQVDMPALGALGMRVRLIDATCISRPGSTTTDWRVHASFDLGTLSLDRLTLTDATVGEALRRWDVAPGELAVADSGYAHRQGLWSVRHSGGHFLVRTTWKSIPLLHPDGTPFDIMHALPQTPEVGAADHPVMIAGAALDQERYSARLVIIRKTPEAAETARKRLRREHQRKQRKGDVDPRTLEAAGYILLVTSVDHDRLSANEVADLYRYRWQVELAFKRLKSLLHLDDLPAYDPDLARTFLLAKLLTAWLLDTLVQKSRDFSPRSCNVRRLPVAGSTSHSQVPVDRHHRRPRYRPLDLR